MKANTAEFNLTFNTVFKITNTALLINGSHPSIERNERWILHYAAGMGLTWFVTSLLVYSIMFSDIANRDLMEASKHITVAIVGFIISFKYVILLKYQNDTMTMMLDMDRDYHKAKCLTLEEQEIVKLFAERGAWVSKMWMYLAICTSSLFPLKALFLMACYAFRGEFKRVMVFEFVLPCFDEIKYENKIYFPLFLIFLFFSYYAGGTYIAFDPLVPIFMLHACGQLELVKFQIGKLFPEDDTYDALATKKKLDDIIRHLHHIYSFAESARSNFKIVYEVILKATTILIPVTCFQIIEGLKMNSLSLEFVSFLGGCVVHFYIPCYYSDLLMETSVSVMDSVYACGWQNHWDRSTRNTFLFMITRAGKPLAMTTAFQSMCLDSFTEMCRQSYSILNLMNASVET